MKALNTNTTSELWQKLRKTINEDDKEGFVQTYEELMQQMREEIAAEQKRLAEEHRAAADQTILATRGHRQLTSEEQKFYTELIGAMKAKDAKQALSSLSVIMPETIVEDVFEELRTSHPLLSKIRFIPSGPITKTILNTNGQVTAVWGELCDEITNELAAGFKTVTTNLLKLSAFLPVCKQGITFGPEWLDRFVRETLYESVANGLEAGIVDGDGNGKPIGMTRQVGAGVSVVGGVYPKKAPISITNFRADTLGNLLSLMSLDESGKGRAVRDMVLLCTYSDYFSKVFPATHIMGPDGEYRRSLPYDIEIIPVANGLSNGEAVLGLGYRYFATVGKDRDGTIDYSDHYKFLEDQRVYLIKAFANGFPLDNNAFQLLDISGLILPYYRVESVTIAPSSNAKLQMLNIGGQALTNAFDPDTISYTLATTHTKDVVTVAPQDAGATVEIKLGNTVKENGKEITWASGSNTLTVKVTAEDGTTTKTYTVTVTKS